MTMTPPRTLDTTRIDTQIERLQAHKNEWARLALRRKRAYLTHLLNKTNDLAPRWVDAAIAAKQIPPDSPLVGEEWVSGPWALMHYLQNMRRTLAALERGDLRMPPRTRIREGGQLIADMYPLNLLDSLILNGFRAEVWMQPGVTEANLRDHMASFYKQPAPQGQVALVLGAGNIASIAPLDVLYKLYAEGQVALLKMNPVNDYLGEFLEEIFAPLVESGYVEFTYGGADVGAYLTGHDGIDTIHITGAARTHDLIVFGPGEEGAARKARNEPLLDKPITSELGAVSPVIVVPGPWTEADMRFQAENITTMKYHNAGFNCVAAQVLIMPSEWAQKDRFLDILAQTMASVEPRVPYYPGAADRCGVFLDAHPEALVFDDNMDAPRLFLRGLNANDEHEVAYHMEVFTSSLAQTELPGSSPAEYLQNAVDFANERLHGTLGANIILHPATIKELGGRLEGFIAQMRYGAVGVNAWSAAAYLLSQCTWGAFPGHPLNDIQSGRGVVHNTFLFDKPEKSVVYGPFTDFPRGLRAGEFHLSPKPSWFVTNRMGHVVGERFTRYEANPGFHHLPGLFLAALRG